jgi:hypothetical protein
MLGLVDKSLLFVIRQSHQRFARHRVPGDEGTPLEEVPVFRKVVFVDKLVDISELIGGDELQGVTSRTC